MNEYKSTIIELALANGKKAKRIKELKEDYKKLLDEYNEMHIDLAKARNYAQMLKNDLKELSTEYIEFNKWRNGKAEKKAKN
jgi:hypothetical protein